MDVATVYFCGDCGTELDYEDVVANLNTWGVCKGVCTGCIEFAD